MNQTSTDQTRANGAAHTADTDVAHNSEVLDAQDGPIASRSGAHNDDAAFSLAATAVNIGADDVDEDDETSEADIEAALRAYDPDETESIETESIEEEDADDEDETGENAAPPGDLDTEEKVRLMAEAADAVRAEDIQVLDLRPLTIIADYFLICTGKSSIQLRAIADRIEEKMRDNGIRKPRMQGYREGTWILLDYGDVVAHLMAAEQRAFYSLEDFWELAPRMTLQLLPDEARSARPTPDSFETLTPALDDENDAEDEDDDLE